MSGSGPKNEGSSPSSCPVKKKGYKMRIHITIPIGGTNLRIGGDIVALLKGEMDKVRPTIAATLGVRKVKKKKDDRNKGVKEEVIDTGCIDVISE